MKTFERKPTDVLPRAQIGNRLGAQCLYDHYVGGMTLGALARRLGLNKGLSAAAAWLRGRAKWVSRVRPIRTSTAVGLSPQPETAAEGSVSSRHIVETLCRARFRIVETERQPRSDPALH